MIIPVSKNTAPKTSSVTFMYIEQIANVIEIEGVRFYVGFLDTDKRKCDESKMRLY